MSGSTVPAAVSALVAAWSGLVATIDGEPYESPPDVFLCVAWDRSDQPAIVRAPFGSGLTSMTGVGTDETFDVSCLLSLWDGGKDPSQMRAAVFALFDSLDAALAADRTLGGVVLQARITEYEFTPARRVEGSAAEIRFTVNHHAWS